MKKSLLALAAMGAFASVAQAQSSVTVYGVIDEGFAGGNTRSSLGGAANTATGVVKTTGGGIIGAAESTNRIGLRGSEDLGGGSSAFFVFETKIDPDTNTNMFSTVRQAFVGLKKNGLGQMTLGSQNTVIYDAVLASDPTGVNNVTGSLIHVTGTGLGTGLGNNSGLLNETGYNTRISNSIAFKSETVSGFTGRALFVAASKNTTQTSQGGAAAGVGGTANVSGQAVGVDYSWQKLNLTANFQSFTASSNVNAATTAPILFGSTAAASAGSTVALGTDVRDVGQYYAANYDFGILKAYAQYISRKASVDSNPSYFSKYTAQQIGVRSYITPTIEAWVAGSVGKYASLPVVNTVSSPYTPPQANLTAMQIGANYWLSKRTNLYAIYGQAGSSNVAQTLGANTISYNQNNYAVGVRHSF